MNEPPKFVALNWIHVIVGALALVAFLGTGLFMDRRLDHLVGMPDAPRALYRSAHIYLLFSALLNLLLGVYVLRAAPRLLRALQYAGSILLVAAVPALLYAFFVETPPAVIERPMLRRAIVWSLQGTLLHVVAGSLARTILARAPIRRSAGPGDTEPPAGSLARSAPGTEIQ